MKWVTVAAASLLSFSAAAQEVNDVMFFANDPTTRPQNFDPWSMTLNEHVIYSRCENGGRPMVIDKVFKHKRTAKGLVCREQCDENTRKERIPIQELYDFVEQTATGGCKWLASGINIPYTVHFESAELMDSITSDQHVLRVGKLLRRGPTVMMDLRRVPGGWVIGKPVAPFGSTSSFVPLTSSKAQELSVIRDDLRNGTFDSPWGKRYGETWRTLTRVPYGWLDNSGGFVPYVSAPNHQASEDSP